MRCLGYNEEIVARLLVLGSIKSCYTDPVILRVDLVYVARAISADRAPLLDRERGKARASKEMLCSWRSNAARFLEKVLGMIEGRLPLEILRLPFEISDRHLPSLVVSVKNSNPALPYTSRAAV